jgi:hypothetical protein
VSTPDECQVDIHFKGDGYEMLQNNTSNIFLLGLDKIMERQSQESLSCQKFENGIYRK